MQVTFHPTINDRYAARKHAYTQWYFWKTMLKRYGIYPLIGTLALTVAFFNTSADLTANVEVASWFGASIVLSIVLFTVGLVYDQLSFVRESRAFIKTIPPTQLETVALTADGVYLTNEGIDAPLTIKWQDVKNILPGKTHIYIRYASNMTIVIPHTGFTSEEACRAYITRAEALFQQAQAGATAPPV